MPSDPKKLKISKQINRSDILMSIARLPDSNRIFVGSSDGKIYDLDVMAEKPQFRELAGHDSYVTGLANVDTALISAAYDRQLIWWDRETGKPIRSVEAHQRWIRQLVVSPDQQLAITVADDMVCRIWDTKTGKQVRELRGHQEKTPHHFPSMLYACTVSPDGKYLATGDRVGHIVVWELATGKELATLETPIMYTWDPKARIHSIGGIRSLAFSAD
jgi:WD40 repeat protein